MEYSYLNRCNETYDVCIYIYIICVFETLPKLLFPLCLFSGNYWQSWASFGGSKPREGLVEAMGISKHGF